MRLEYDVVRFTVIPEQGTQVWAQIPVVRVKLALDLFPDSVSLTCPLRTPSSRSHRIN